MVFIRHLIRHLIRRFLRRRGLDLVRISSDPGREAPLAEQLTDQLLAQGQADLDAYPVPVEELTWDNGFSMRTDGWNPYLRTVRDYLNGDCESYERSALQRFYRFFQPETAADYLCPDLPEGGPLATTDAAAYIHPWSLRSPRQRLDERRRQNREEERLAAGFSGLGTAAPRGGQPAGVNRMGPVSPEKGRIEFNRLVKLADSINTRGYDRTMDLDIEAAAVRRGGEMRYVIVSGYHRAAVLAALGRKHIPVLLKPRQILDEALLMNAPALRRGFWNSEELAIYLDYLFRETGAARAEKLGLL